MAFELNTRVSLSSFSALLLAAVLLAPGEASRQSFRAKSDLVVLQAVVLDRHAVVVSDLTQEDFRVYEDSAPQAIRFFVSEDRPVAVGLVVDNSLSMMNKRGEVIAAADAFARSSNPGDALFTVNFNEGVSFGLPPSTPFTSDLAVLHDALSQIQTRGKTAMYDAIAAALDHVAAGPIEDRVLIVVSDGGDNASRIDFKGVLERVQRSNAVIYAVGIVDDLAADIDRHALRRLAEATGGLALFPEKLRQVGPTLDRIAHDIRHRYTIGYVAENPRRDAGFRNVRIVAFDHKTHKPLLVRSRTGYFPS